MHTINGLSLVLRLTFGSVRAFFSGDFSKPGSDHLLTIPNSALGINANIFNAPYHGSHEFSPTLLEAVNPVVTVVSYGRTLDNGHPNANFLGAVGHVGRGVEPLLFSTKIAALFVDLGDPNSVMDDGTVNTLGDLDFSRSAANAEARRRFKKILAGIINIRSDGEQIFAFQRVHKDISGSDTA